MEPELSRSRKERRCGVADVQAFESSLEANQTKPNQNLLKPLMIHFSNCFALNICYKIILRHLADINQEMHLFRIYFRGYMPAYVYMSPCIRSVSL